MTRSTRSEVADRETADKPVLVDLQDYQLFDCLTIGVMVVSRPVMKVLFLNSAASQILGISADQIRGKAVGSIRAFGDPGTVQTYLEKFADGESGGFTIRLCDNKLCRFEPAQSSAFLHDAIIVQITTFPAPAPENTLQQTGDSPERLGAVIDASRLAVITLDRTFAIESWNTGATELFGFSALEAVGRPLSFLTPIDLAWEDEVFRRAVVRGEVIDGTSTFRLHKDGHRVEVAVRLVPVKLGPEPSYALLATDRTAGLLIEEDNRKLFREVTELWSAIDESTLVSATDPDGVITYVNDRFCELSGFSREELIGSTHEVVRSGHHSEDYYLELWETIRSGRVWYGEIENRRKNGEYYWLETTIVPLVDNRGAPTAYISLRHDITQRKETARALDESRERMRLATEATGVGIWEWNIRTNDVVWDDQMFRMYGVAPTPNGVVTYEVWRNAVHPDDIEEQERIVKETIANQRQSRRAFRVADHNGGWRQMEAVQTVRLGSDGEVEWVVGTNIDVTSREQNIRDLARSEKSFRSLVKATSQMVWRASPEGRILETMDWELLSGATDEDPVAAWRAAVHPADIDETLAKWFWAVQHSVQYEHEYRLKHADGDYHQVIARAVPIFEGDTPVEWVGTITDVTNERRALAELRESELQFRQLSEGVPQLVWTCRADDGLCDYVGPQWVEFTGCATDDLTGRGWLDRVHPDDRESALTQWEEAFSSERVFLADFRIRRHDGVYRWFQARAIPLRDSDGCVQKWFGSNADIDDRKRAEVFVALMNAVNDRLAQVSSFGDFVGFLGAGFADLLDVALLAAVEIDPSGGEAQVCGEWRRPGVASLEGTYTLIDYVNESLVQELRHGETVVVSDTSNDGRIPVSQRFADLGIGSMTIVPLLTGGSLRYVFGVFSQEPRIWLPDQIVMLEETAKRLWNHYERQRVEQQLAEEQSRLEKIAASSPNAICSFRLGDDSSLRFTFVSPGIERIAGVSVESITSGEVDFMSRILSDDRPHVRISLRRSARTRHLWNETFRFQHQTKGEVWIETFATPVVERDGTVIWHGIFNEITERKKAEAEILESEKKYRLLFETNPLPMWVYDLESLAFLAVNDAAVLHYGYTRSEFLGMTLRDIRPAEEITTLYGAVKRVKNGLKHSGIFRHRKKDGTVIQVEVSSHSIVFAGRAARLVLANDITERDKAERMIRELNETLEQKVALRTAELNAVNRELEAFSYSVSHDLRAPLRAMDGFALAVLEDYADKIDETGQGYLNRIRGASQRMAGLIDDLLKLSRVSRREIFMAPVDLTALANEVAAYFCEAEPDRRAGFEIEDGLTAFADENLMRVALENLLGNAWKFTSRKESAKIRVGAKVEGGKRVFFVADNGAGFDMNYGDRLFSAFQRLHSASEFEGTGIGLATVQRIIHRHGGTIRAEGEPEVGATFYFTLEA